jgi:hypothetical protein
MCEVLRRNISDFYVNLRVEVGKFYVRFLKIFYSETTGKFTLAMSQQIFIFLFKLSKHNIYLSCKIHR